jgi:hypothetical protein
MGLVRPRTLRPVAGVCASVDSRPLPPRRAAFGLPVGLTALRAVGLPTPASWPAPLRIALFARQTASLGRMTSSGTPAFSGCRVLPCARPSSPLGFSLTERP